MRAKLQKNGPKSNGFSLSCVHRKMRMHKRSRHVACMKHVDEKNTDTHYHPTTPPPHPHHTRTTPTHNE